MKLTIELLATWFRLGHLKPAPGTWGTLGGIPVVLFLNLLSPIGYMVGAGLFMLFATLVAEFYERQVEGHDRSEVVIDEVAGFAIAMTWLPLTWQAWLGAFVVFRILDALKPPPLSWIDQKIKGGLGVVADDIAAGIITNFIMQIVFVQTAWLGYQLAS